ncbi:MAG: SPFH domain-containing protein [Planctomycetia bacterium]|nr:SPFH domain-containing protein [Planctomycetia bacterium]
MSRRKPGKILFQGVDAGMKLFHIAALVLIALFWLSGIGSVKPKNVGLLTRFGKLIPYSEEVPQRGPGFVLAFPYPIDQLVEIPAEEEQRLLVSDVWASWEQAGADTNAIDPVTEGYCLTGDNNIVQANVVVKYKITNPSVFHFDISDAETMIRSVFLAALSETAATWSGDQAVRTQRVVEVPNPAGGEPILVQESLSQLAAERTQQKLDRIECGITITGVEFTGMHYPRHIKADIENLQSTDITNQARLSQAQKEANALVSAAMREVDNRLTDAKNFHLAVTTEAKNEQAQFLALYREFCDRPEQTWQRMYAETMEQIWSNVGKLRVAPPNSRIILSDEEEVQQ